MELLDKAHELVVQERYKEAIAIYKNLDKSDFDPNKKAAIFSKMGGCYYFSNEFDEALKWYKKAHMLSSDDESISIGIYLTLVKLGRTEEAIEELNWYASNHEIVMYRDTLTELMEDMQRGVATYFKSIVYSLAEKHGVPLIISE